MQNDSKLIIKQVNGGFTLKEIALIAYWITIQKLTVLEHPIRSIFESA